MPESRLVPFDERHVPDRVAWLTHPAVRSGVPIHGPVTEQSTLQWAARIAAAADREDFVLESPRGEALVMCGVTSIDEPSCRGELYMFADPFGHGRGHGSAALEQLCHWAFDVRGLNRLFLYTLGHNSAARRFYERGGFAEEGRLRQHQSHGGELVDRYVHGLLAEDWRRLKRG